MNQLVRVKQELPQIREEARIAAEKKREEEVLLLLLFPFIFPLLPFFSSFCRHLLISLLLFCLPIGEAIGGCEAESGGEETRGHP